MTGARIVDASRGDVCHQPGLLAVAQDVERRAKVVRRFGERRADVRRELLAAALYPDVAVKPDVLYVDAGQVLTSAGSAAGVDLMLHIVRQDFGARAANDIARRMVMAPHREGGQAQFIERPVPRHAADRLGSLLEAVRRRPCEHWTIARMARRVAMSQRTFIRRFQESTGMGPGEWVIAARLEVARFLLESTAADLDAIARSSGFGNPAALRHHLRRRVGLTPSAYRASFRAA